MMLDRLINHFRIRDLIVAFCNTGDEDKASLQFLNDQERHYNIDFTWLEYDFPEGFEELLVMEPTYKSLSKLVDSGRGFEGFYRTDLLDEIRWKDEYKKEMNVPKSVIKEQMNLFGVEFLETVADYNRMLKDFYALFGSTRGKLGENRFKVVNFEYADRGGIPLLKDLIYKNAIRYTKGLPFVVPNPAQRFCTGDLKERVADDYMKGRGFKHYVTALGIRRDEEKRYFNNTSDLIWMPLFELGITTEDVRAFWDSMPFQLSIRNEKWMGNCVDCHLKTLLKRVKACQNDPSVFERRALIEKAAGDFMKRKEPSQKIIDLAKSIVVTEEDIKNDKETQLNCFC